MTSSGELLDSQGKLSRAFELFTSLPEKFLPEGRSGALPEEREPLG
jgi:hypothetical protein